MWKTLNGTRFFVSSGELIRPATCWNSPRNIPELDGPFERTTETRPANCRLNFGGPSERTIEDRI
eukprot:10654157-Lingulodinium_polyedra.AAC.1